MINEPEVLPGHSAFPRSLIAGLERSHLPSLDGIRAIAAFMVVFYHLDVLWISGGTGVLVFFVLSGFLITWLLLKEEERFGKISLKLFYMRRTLRIMPAFYVYWFFIVGSLIVFSKHLHIAQAIASFFYVNNYYQAIVGDPNTGLSHTWSLGVEEQFYLLWPICFILLKRNQNRLRFLLCATAGVWIYRELLVLVFHDPQGYIYEAFDTRADHLMIGCLLAVALKERAWPRIWSALTAIPNLIWVTFAGLLCSGAAEHFLGVRYRDGIGFILEPILAAVLIVQGVAHGSSGLGRILNWSWVSYLGTISYSIYLYHPISIGIGRRLAHKLPLVSSIAALAVVIIVSSLSYLIVEKPMLQLRSRLHRRKVSRSEPESAAELTVSNHA
jgi:peptidoglycan/LPS O-acetylase OafA/YrhL